MHLSLLELSLLTGTGVVAGAIGAMVGIGGGILLIPILVLGFRVPIHVAVATSLVAVIATSSAAGSVYVGKGLTNMRLAMTLELATTTGAITGGLVAALLPASVLDVVFAIFTVITAVLLFRGKAKEPAGARSGSGEAPAGHEVPGKLAGAFHDPATGRNVEYQAVRVPLGLAVSFAAGSVSGLLGVGGGFLKVPAMSLGMKVPLKVAAATSNFMIGVTAAASLIIYVQRGFLVPFLAAPVALGVAGGALAGTGLAARIHSRHLARGLAVLLVLAAVQMGLKSAGVELGR